MAFTIDIDSKQPSCGNCLFGRWECSDDDYNSEEWFDCGSNSPSIPWKIISDISDEQVKASSCGHYMPTYASHCAGCKKPMNHIPIYKVEHWAFSMAPEACCSEKCKVKRNNQIYWDFHWWGEKIKFSTVRSGMIFRLLAWRIKSLLSWPESEFK